MRYLAMNFDNKPRQTGVYHLFFRLAFCTFAFMMTTLQFKTNINCGNCLRAVSPTLNAEPAIQSWQVDTDNPNKLLTITSDLTAAEVVALVEEAGFRAEAA